MKRRTILQLGVLVLLGMGVLFSLMTFDQAGRRDPELLEVSVIIREADNTGWSAARQGMEQAAADLGAELRFLTLSEPDSVEEQRSLLAREVEGGADAVVLVPADAQALGPDVARAAAGAAVVTMESDLAASGAKACITVDNAALGTALAKQILRDIPQGSGDEIRGNLDANGVAEPDGAGDAGNLLDLVDEVVGIGGGHALHDEHTGGRHVERFLQKTLTLNRIQIFRQIRQNIIVYPGADIAQRRGNQQQDSNQCH